MSEKEASTKTLCRLTFQEVIKLRKITDGVHNPYVYAKWIPEKDIEGLIAELQTELEGDDGGNLCVECPLILKCIEYEKRFNVKCQAFRTLERILVSLGAKKEG